MSHCQAGAVRSTTPPRHALCWMPGWPRHPCRSLFQLLTRDEGMTSKKLVMHGSAGFALASSVSPKAHSSLGLRLSDYLCPPPCVGSTSARAPTPHCVITSGRPLPHPTHRSSAPLHTLSHTQIGQHVACNGGNAFSEYTLAKATSCTPVARATAEIVAVTLSGLTAIAALEVSRPAGHGSTSQEESGRGAGSWLGQLDPIGLPTGDVWAKVSDLSNDAGRSNAA